jgi:hypothetical protein
VFYTLQEFRIGSLSCKRLQDLVTDHDISEDVPFSTVKAMFEQFVQDPCGPGKLVFPFQTK